MALHTPGGQEPPFTHHVRPRLVVKYHDAITLPDLPGEGLEGSLLIPGWKDFRRQFPGLRNRRLVRRPVDSIRMIGKQAGERDPRYRTRRIENYLVFEIPDGPGPEEVRDFARQERLGGAIEFAYVASPPVPPPATYPLETAEGAMQSYLDVSENGGIDARYAWEHPGGDGRGQSFYDVEWGWALGHKDLPTSTTDLIGGFNYSYFHHGTAALGIVASKSDGAACIGIAHGVSRVRCASSWRDAGGDDFEIADALWDVITEVVKNEVRGAVLLLEEQVHFYDRQDVPAESMPAVQEMVRVATRFGITVIAPAGNGDVDLDGFVDDSGRAFLDPDAPGFDDSGAIFVGAASSAAPHARLAGSNYGRRVNCFAWGDTIYSPTTNAYGTDLDAYDYALKLTSGASAIVAGAALVLQGLATAETGSPLSPGRMREILGHGELGTAPQGGREDRIGRMPNLRQIIDEGLLGPEGIT